MVKLICVNKNGDVVNKNINSIDLIYKSCMFRNDNNFEKQYIWNNVPVEGKMCTIELWGKNKGTKNNLNVFCSDNIETKSHIHGTVAFAFYDDSGNWADFSLNHWNIFLTSCLQGKCETSSEETDISEIEDDEHNEEEIVGDHPTELTYEEYYYSSNDEN